MQIFACVTCVIDSHAHITHVFHFRYTKSKTYVHTILLLCQLDPTHIIKNTTSILDTISGETSTRINPFQYHSILSY